ncbi:MAG: DUF4838 domain-containing protein [Kiritimatiellae bacterium]|nr:DUF4838 domain-containing protein [Kiritimatiellia bacterium]
MKKILMVLSIVLFSFASFAFIWPSKVTIVSDAGKSNAKIVIAQNPSAVAQFAARELQEHVKCMTGTVLPILPESELKKGDYPIYIGSRVSATKDIDVKKLPVQGYVVDINKNRTVLFGEDASRTNLVRIGYGENPSIIKTAIYIPSEWEKRGSLNAVYTFLDNICGVKWLDCTEAGTFVPNVKSLIVKSQKIVDGPFVRCRDAKIAPEEWDVRRDVEGFEKYQRTAWPTAFAELKKPVDIRTRISATKKVFGLRLRIGGEKIHCNHSLYWFYDRFYSKDNKLFIESKREWFSKHLKKNKKDRASDDTIFAGYDTSRKPAQMCYSNDEFLRQVVQDVRDYFDNGGYTNRFSNQGVPCSAKNPVATWGKDVYAIEPMDNAAFCECPKCIKQYKPERIKDRAECSDYWFNFVNKIAREIKKSHPGKKISTLAYGSRREGLPSFPIEDNVVVHFCWDSNREPNREPLMTMQMDLIRKWRNAYPKRELGLWLYNGFPHESGTWWKYIPPPGFFGTLFDKEMKFIRDMNIRECIFNCGLKDDFELYLGGKLMWNPSEDYTKLKNEYFSSFGPAEKPMRKFYDFIEERYCNTNNYNGFNGHINREIAYTTLFTKKEFDILEGIINEAENIVEKKGSSWHKSRVKNWRVGYWELLLSSRYKKDIFPSPAKGVSLKKTECYYGSTIPLGGNDVLAGLPFSVKSTGGGSLYFPKTERKERASAIYSITSPTGFHGFWTGKAPTELEYRCNVKIKKLKRVRIVTYDYSRSLAFFDLVGWRNGKKVVLVKDVSFSKQIMRKGFACWDIDFDEESAPLNLDGIGIEDKFWKAPYYRNSPRYMRIMAVDATQK